MILRFILITLGFYVLYKLVFDLIIPVSRATSKIRRQFGDMQQQMQDHMNAQQNAHPPQSDPPPNPGTRQTRAGDYIDFEEVKP